jgi:hypothetical protein
MHTGQLVFAQVMAYLPIEAFSRMVAARRVTCPEIFRPSVIRDNDSLTARSSDEECTIYGRADLSHIARN